MLEIPLSGDVVVGGKPMPDASLENLFRAAFTRDKNTQVVLKADKGVPHGRVVNLMERAKAVGLSRLRDRYGGGRQLTRPQGGSEQDAAGGDAAGRRPRGGAALPSPAGLPSPAALPEPAAGSTGSATPGGAGGPLGHGGRRGCAGGGGHGRAGAGGADAQVLDEAADVRGPRVRVGDVAGALAGRGLELLRRLGELGGGLLEPGRGAPVSDIALHALDRLARGLVRLAVGACVEQRLIEELGGGLDLGDSLAVSSASTRSRRTAR